MLLLFLANHMDRWKKYFLDNLARGAAAVSQVEALSNRGGLYSGTIATADNDPGYFVCRIDGWETEPLKDLTGGGLSVGDAVLISFCSNAERRGFIVHKVPS